MRPWQWRDLLMVLGILLTLAGYSADSAGWVLVSTYATYIIPLGIVLLTLWMCVRLYQFAAPGARGVLDNWRAFREYRDRLPFDPDGDGVRRDGLLVLTGPPATTPHETKGNSVQAFRGRAVRFSSVEAEAMIPTPRADEGGEVVPVRAGLDVLYPDGSHTITLEVNSRGDAVVHQDDSHLHPPKQEFVQAGRWCVLRIERDADGKLVASMREVGNVREDTKVHEWNVDDLPSRLCLGLRMWYHRTERATDDDPPGEAWFRNFRHKR